VDGTGDGGGALTAAGLVCGSCGTDLPPNSKFCNECGAPVTELSRSAEYKQVTVLFADVVHSMDIAAIVGAERLREIMADLADRCAAVVQRYRGTVDKFTGDGIMAVFGAPTALEDHAIRACLAALGIREEAKRLAVDVRDRDGVELLLRKSRCCGCALCWPTSMATRPPTATIGIATAPWRHRLASKVT
jgi:adenylate cyclase